ncbi:type IV secretion system protein VirB10 [Paraburkholderia fungorum]|uniref:Type IV secretion system protein VirB10 n=1 Tax=Paraburkholderia fungorum TaxID=134537 RepID=A0A1H1JX50_9BURK|nr:TrbI/VirB10 family protein [Paraburkholderia fungorum]SDR54319.1 type IV secretion system protein VirB10 [Paraburkholderia fungorum]
MAQQNTQPTGDQAAIVKGKSPRNALISAGVVAAVVIAGLGFYYQVKESGQLEEEAKLQKKAKAAEVVDKTNNTQDVDKIIEEQQSDARRIAASEARAAVAPRSTGSPDTKPGITADDFNNEERTHEIKAQSDSDAIFASPIFRAGLKVKDTQQQQQIPQLAGILTPQQVAAQQAAAQQAATGSANAQAAALVASGQQAGRGGLASTQDQDTAFMRNAGAQSADGQDFARAGFVGQAHGCVLSPPHHIPVLSMEGLNSDRPGTAALLVEKDVYDSIRGDCLMIPKGTTITAPYSSDIKPGQESILVAATEMRLPNGKHVPLFGGQGADADGAAGFSGDVNNHFLKIFGTSFLTAILLRKFDGGDTSTTTGPLGVTQVGSTGGQVAAQTAQSVLDRYKNIPPTITTDLGQHHFMIKVNRDIYMEPYRGD